MEKGQGLCSAEAAAYSTPEPTRTATLRSSLARKTFDPFAGANGRREVEDLTEFRELGKVDTYDGFVFQEVDFRSLDYESVLSLNVKGALFLGCKFPPGVTEDLLRGKGATVMSNEDDLPFRPYRAFLYTQEELQKMDDAAFSYYLKEEKGIRGHMYMSIHDFSVQDALLDYAEGKSFVSVMGGHAILRGDPTYADCVQLGVALARRGFVVTTGGGPGAMEAANLGAYLYQKDEKTFNRALEILRRPSTVTPQYKDVATAQAVIDEIGPLSCCIPSLGIPTWKYGHEPSNRFAALQAKFFNNALREEILLHLCYGGLVVTPGGPGTLQEVFTAVCRCAYAKTNHEYPIIFMGKKFWTDNGVFALVKAQAQGRAFGAQLLLSDDVEEIACHLHHCALQKSLPLLLDPQRQLCNPYWRSLKLSETEK